MNPSLEQRQLLVSCELFIHEQLVGIQLKIIANQYGFRCVQGCVLIVVFHLVCALCIVRLMFGLIFVTVNWLVNFCAYWNFHNETLSAGLVSQNHVITHCLRICLVL